MSSTIDTFATEIAKAMSIAMAAPGELPAAIKRVDELYVTLLQAGEKDALERKIRSEILIQFRQHPELFARFNFASSLAASPQSPFYSAVIEVCRGHFPNLTPEEMLTVIEKCRRAGMYPEMEQAVAALQPKLGHPQTYYALRLNGKAYYERHMAAYQQGVKAIDQYEKEAFFRESMGLAELSAGMSKSGDDPIGALFALMNIGGLLMWRFKPWQEAIAHSTNVCVMAEALAASSTDDTARNRAYRVAMSTYMFRIDIAAQFGGEVADVEAWLARLQANPIHLSAKDEEWANKPVEQALTYIRTSRRYGE